MLYINISAPIIMKSHVIFVKGFKIKIKNLFFYNFEKEIIHNILNNDIENTITRFEKYKREYESYSEYDDKKYNINAKDTFYIKKDKQIKLYWSYGILFYLAAINNSKDVLNFHAK
ncbi:hypothetical protein H1Q59_07775 [Holosporaceae bacterium 'Namur']|nr:hypothetical protein [Holosporaceae bacterium 'Namur']